MTHSELVTKLVKPGDEIFDELDPRACHLIHMLLGLTGEIGELVDAIKKNIIYNKIVDRENVIEELGDLEFYLEGFRQVFEVTREETLEANIAKLTKRYHTLTYSDQHAQERVDKA